MTFDLAGVHAVHAQAIMTV